MHALISMFEALIFHPTLSNGQLAYKVSHAFRVHDMLLILLVEFDAGGAEIL